LNPAFTTRDLQSGDRIVLCSDGLWDMLEDVDIAGITRFSSNPKEAVFSLIAAADDAGGLDNITAVVIFQ
jgi:protein phosphatase